MDWTRAIREECEALKRIVALLCALADLAEMTCDRSAAVRGFVLWLLRRADRVAWSLVAADCETAEHRHIAGSPNEAMSLASSFRDLAEELVGQMEDLALLAFSELGENSMPPRRFVSGVHASMSELLATAFCHPRRNIPLPDTS